MAIAIDASTPVILHGGGGSGATLVSSSFSPPANSLVLLAAFDDDHATATNSVTDSLGTHLNWTKLVEAATGVASAAFWVADVGSSAPGSMTATVTWTSTQTNIERAIVIIVLTGADVVANQVASAHTAVHNTTPAAIPSLAVSAAASTSWILGAFANFSNTAIGTPTSGQTQTFNGHAMTYTDATNGDSGWFQGNSAVGNTNLTMSVTAGSIQHAGVAAEILAPSGGAPSVASTAASVGAATAVLTTPKPLAVSAVGVSAATATITTPSGGPAFVQAASTSSGATAGSSVSQAFSSNVTAGDLIVVAWGATGTSSVGGTVTDLLGTVYAYADGPYIGINGQYIMALAYGVAPSSGANTVTVSFTTTPTFRRLTVAEYSGVNSLDQHGHTDSIGGPAISSASITTTQPHEILFAWIAHNSGISSAGTGWTSRATPGSMLVEDEVDKAAGSYTVTATAAGSDYYNIQYATFSVASIPALVPVAASVSAATATVVAGVTPITPVQTKNSAWVISATNSGTVSFTSNVTAGNSIVVLLGWVTFNATPPVDPMPVTISDNHGNTYNLEPHEILGATHRGVAIAKADNVASGATTITVTSTGVCYLAAALFELPPCLSMSANGAGYNFTSGNLHTGNLRMLDGGLVLTSAMVDSATANPINVTLPSGFTSLSGVSVFPGTNNAGFLAGYATNSTDGFVDEIWNANEVMNPTVAAWCMVAATELRPRLIQTAAQTSSGATPIATQPLVLPALGVQKGNRIIVAVGGNDLAGVAPNDHTGWTVTDDQGNTYHKDAEVLLTSNYWIQTWSAIAATSAQTTVSWNAHAGANATFLRLITHEVFNASTGIDDIQTPTGNGATVSGSVSATRNANEYLFGWLVHNAALNSGVNSPWAQIGLSTSEITVQYIPGATGTYAVTAPAGSSDFWATNLLSYYRTPSGGAPALSPTVASVSAAAVLISAPTRLAPFAASVSAATAAITAPSTGGPVAIAAAASSISAASAVLQAGVPQLHPASLSISAATARITAPIRFTASAQSRSATAASIGTGGLVHFVITSPRTLAVIMHDTTMSPIIPDRTLGVVGVIGYPTTLVPILHDTTLRILIG